MHKQCSLEWPWHCLGKWYKQLRWRKATNSRSQRSFFFLKRGCWCWPSFGHTFGRFCASWARPRAVYNLLTLVLYFRVCENFLSMGKHCRASSSKMQMLHLAGNFRKIYICCVRMNKLYVVCFFWISCFLVLCQSCYRYFWFHFYGLYESTFV